ncbi:MAG: peroxidase-related enzyme [Verrucomicrobiales bacterium]|nr:peroxidase-related enzyme [Verrucomicrobiales bacterium]
MRLIIGVRVPDVLRVILHRSEFFGQHYYSWTHSSMRGPSDWSIGQRELFAAFTSRLNQCQFCLGHHRATSVQALGIESLVRAVLEDWKTAPLDQKTKAMLAFLRKLTLEPFDVGAADIAPLRAAGLSDAAIEDAIHICASFNIINRIADALAFELPSAKGLARSTEILLTRGYQ